MNLRHFAPRHHTGNESELPSTFFGCGGETYQMFFRAGDRFQVAFGSYHRSPDGAQALH
jgi:hypothetical protein